jgi:hypothetical protein
MATICSSVNRVFFIALSWPGERHSLKLQLVRKSPGTSLNYPILTRAQATISTDFGYGAALVAALAVVQMTPETALKPQIKDYPDLKGVFHFPIMQGLGAKPGLPDRVAVKDGHFMGIEIKAPNGRLSEHQKRFRDELVAAGGTYVEARSLEDVMAFFR